MRKRLVALLLSLFIVISTWTGSPVVAKASANETVRDNKLSKDDVKQKEYVEGEVIVKFKAGVSASGVNSMLNQQSLKIKRNVPIRNTKVAHTPKGTSVPEMVAELERNPLVEWVQPNYLYYPQTTNVSDPMFGELWGMNNQNDIDIDIPEAWDFTQGSEEIIVAVLDTGVKIDHPDLASRIWVNTDEIPDDGVDNDDNGYIDDINGWDFYYADNTVFDPIEGDLHGTHVAGTIAASVDDIGVVGVAPKVKIMPLKFIGTYGGSTADAIAAIEYAKQNGAKIVNNSWASFPEGENEDLALKEAFQSANMVMVAAAGNYGADVDISANTIYPAGIDSTNLISVAATDSSGNLASFSNWGINNVHVGAPGVDVLSTTPYVPEVGAAVYSNTYSAMYFGFGLEQISDVNQRTSVIEKALTKMGVAKTDSILLVDDDNSEDNPDYYDYRDFYLDALSQAGYNAVDVQSYAVTAQGPDVNTMLQYDVVIWYSGNSYGDDTNAVLKPEDLDNLRTYLHQSGRILLTGNDLAWDSIDDPLFTDYLGVSILEEECIRYEVVGMVGTEFSEERFYIEGPYPYYKDGLELTENSNATILFEYPVIKDYTMASGTSMAAPHVSGIAALLLSLEPNLTPEQVIGYIKDTVVPLESLDGKTSTGGMVNAYNALAKISKPEMPSGLSGSVVNGEVQLEWLANIEPDLLGYNIYMKIGAGDFVKINENPVTENSYVVSDLDNPANCIFRITAVDIYNDESEYSEEMSIAVELAAPVIVSVGTANMSGLVSNNNAPEVVVNGLQPGDQVYLSLNGTEAIAPVTSAGSSVSIPLTNLVDGTYHITARYVDGNGLESPGSSSFEYTVDTTPPPTPVIDEVDGKTSPALSVNGTPQIVITNLTPGDDIEVFDGEIIKDSFTATESNKTLNMVALSEGEHHLRVVATDQAGNSSPSADFIYIIDTTAPLAPIIASVGDKTSSPALGNNKNPQVVVNGVYVDDIVQLFDGTNLITSQGAIGNSVTFNLTDLTDGEYNFTAKAVDKAGNVSATSVQFTYTVDTVQPQISHFIPDNMANVPINGNIELIFSEDMDGSSFIAAAVYLKSIDYVNEETVFTTVPISVYYSGIDKKLIIDPAQPLEYSQSYTLFLNGVVKDLAGNLLFDGSHNYNFDTEPDTDTDTDTNTDTDTDTDTDGPQVTNITPTSNATQVAVNTNIEFTFNEDVVRDTVYNSVYLIYGSSKVPVVISYNEATKKVTIDPVSNLENSKVYTVKIEGVRDLLGNATTTSWTFTTVAATSNSDPGPGSTGGGTVPANNTQQKTYDPSGSADLTSGDLKLTIPAGAADKKLTVKLSDIASGDSAFTSFANLAGSFAEKVVSAFEFSISAEDGNFALKKGMTVSIKTATDGEDYGLYRFDSVLGTLVPIKTTENKDGLQAVIYQPSKLLVVQEKNTDFGDVVKDNWATTYIRKLAQKNIINGTNKGKFEPNGTLTREQLAKIVTLATAIPGKDGAQGFRDVQTKSWSMPFINSVKSAGVITGYADGRFKPDKAVTRAELLKMVITASGIALPEQGNAFGDTKGHWAEKYVGAAVKAGIINGYEDGKFRPDATVTRAEAAKIIALASGFVIAKE